MGKTSNKISIRVLLTLVIFFATFTILLVTATIILLHKTEEIKNTHAREAETISRILAQDFLRVVLLNDTDVTIDMVKKIEAFPDIAHVSLLDKKNNPILNYTRPGLSAIDVSTVNANIYSVDKNLHDITTSLMYNGVDYGKVHIYFFNKTFNREFILFIEQTWYLVPILLLLSFVVSLYFQRFFTGPIRVLSVAVEELENLDHSLLDMNLANSKEMSNLFSGFQDMAIKINQTQATLAEQKERLHIMLESIADGVIATDASGKVTYINPAAEHITQWGKQDAINAMIEEVYPIFEEEENVSISRIIDETIMTGVVHFCLEDTSIMTRGGDTIPIKSTISPIRNQNKKITGTIIIFQNVSETRALSNELKHQASHDALTNLVNRTEFEKRIISLNSNSEAGSNHALLYLDLDQFKIVNDTSGHTAGDALLKQVAILLHEDVRDTDTVARLGGDEFAVLLQHCTSTQAIEIAEKIRERINNFTFVWQEKPFKVGVSIGVVPIEDSIQTADDLLRDADLACYAAKDSGRNRVHVYRIEDKALELRHSEMNWVSRIRDAINEDRLVLYAQYVRAIEVPNNINHIEVLVRYLDEDEKITLPGVFLPAVERYGLAPELDRWVIHNVLGKKVITDQLRNNSNLRVNINLSGHTLSDPAIVDYVANAIKESQLPPRTICFEITETAAVANLAATAHFMRKIKLLGCEFALDDFGIGVSSFAYLKNLPVDYLKIDGSFVQDIDTNPVNRAMVTAINEIGHVMKIKTIAEFVSNASVCEVLQSLEIDYAQGYFVHKPCPLIEIFKEIDEPVNRSVCGG